MPTDQTPDSEWEKVLSWAEHAGIENMRGKHESAKHLTEQANNTLTVLLAGLGGSLAYASKVLDPGEQPIAFGAAVLCGYLCILAMLLVQKCLRIGPMPPIFNQPEHLAQPDYTLASLRNANIKQLGQRIIRAADRNDETARWLNNIRTLAIFAPVVFVLAVGSR